MLSNEEIKNRLLGAVNEFILTSFQPNVYHYLFERDIQGNLLMLLRQRIDQTLLVNERTILNLVYSEYGETSEVRRVDLACLDPTKLVTCCGATSAQEKGQWWNQPILVGIELKLIISGYPKGFRRRLKDDQEKLEKYRGTRFSPNFTYLALCFAHDRDAEDYRRMQKTIEVSRAAGEVISVSKIEDFNKMYLVTSSAIYEYLGGTKQESAQNRAVATEKNP